LIFQPLPLPAPIEREDGLMCPSLSTSTRRGAQCGRARRGESNLAAEREGEMTDKMRARYLVKVPPGVELADAIAEHRERTGYGGAIVIRFERQRRGVGAEVRPAA
jgi:hypothetical protein